MSREELDPCQHDSCSGDEGPIVDLPGRRDVVRWRCDGCDQIVYDDEALARLRLALGVAEARIRAARRCCENAPDPQGFSEQYRRGYAQATATIDGILYGSIAIHDSVAAVAVQETKQ